jgi:hypothetical protein
MTGVAIISCLESLIVVVLILYVAWTIWNGETDRGYVALVVLVIYALAPFWPIARRSIEYVAGVFP